MLGTLLHESKQLAAQGVHETLACQLMKQLTAQGVHETLACQLLSAQGVHKHLPLSGCSLLAC